MLSTAGLLVIFLLDRLAMLCLLFARFLLPRPSMSTRTALKAPPSAVNPQTSHCGHSTTMPLARCGALFCLEPLDNALQFCPDGVGHRYAKGPRQEILLGTITEEDVEAVDSDVIQSAGRSEYQQLGAKP